MQVTVHNYRLVLYFYSANKGDSQYKHTPLTLSLLEYYLYVTLFYCVAKHTLHMHIEIYYNTPIHLYDFTLIRPYVHRLIYLSTIYLNFINLTS